MGRYCDTASIIQVIGNIYNDVNLLDNEEYHFSEDDFCEQFHKILFGSIFNLHALGAKEITLNAIEDYLSQRPTLYAVYKTNKGPEYLERISQQVEPATFDYYYKRMKKFTLLRMYQEKCKMNLNDLYDVDNILNIKKKQAQEDWLDNTSIEQIADTIDQKIMNIRLTYVDNADESADAAGEGALELIEKLRNTPEMGYPLYSPLLTTVLRGARLGKFYLRSAATGVGKAIPNDTLIPTPIGWRKVRDIQVGDYLFGQDGKPTKVLATYPQSEQKEIWEVEFADGRIAKCCGEHLWEYRYESHKGFAYRIENTQTLYEKTLKLKNGFKDNCNKGFRFHVKLNEAVEYPNQEYDIHPYVLGALLGGGSLRYSLDNKVLTFSSNTNELPNKIASLLPGNYIASKNNEFNYNYTFKPVNNLKHNLWVEELFENYPDLWQVKSEDKFIPDKYLMGSIEQRYELLKGLLDTNGSIEEKGHINFTTVSPRLRDNIIELVRSLGMTATYLIDNRVEKYSTEECYNVYIQSKKEIKPLMFSLKHKVNIAKEYAKSNKRSEYKDHLAIVNIRKTTKRTDMTCFTVDNNNHLFLMNDYIVTHNTRTMIADACSIACNEIWSNEKKCWIRNGTKEPTLFITTEQDREEIQTMMIAFLSGVNEEHLLTGVYEKDEWDRVVYAINLLKNSPLYVQQLPDFSMQDIENTIKRGIRDHGVRYVFHDYIHSSLKILQEVTSKAGIKGMREDNVLFMISIRLKDICNKYQIFIMSATQLNGSYAEAERFDQNLLRGAKSIADKIDAGLVLLGASQDDLKALDPLIKANHFEKPIIKLSIYKNRRGRYKDVLLWCRADLGTCRVEPMFMTDYQYKLIDVPVYKVNVKEPELIF